MKPDQDDRAKLEEVERLKEILARNSIPLPEPEKKATAGRPCLPAPSEIANVAAPLEKSKVALFQSLFRGREDVYAERWRMKDGEWGYRPAGNGPIEPRPFQFLFWFPQSFPRPHGRGPIEPGCAEI